MCTPLLRVLAIDDEPLMESLIRRMLNGTALVQGAASLAQGLALLATAPFDVILCDLNMPGGGALELRGYLRLHHPQLAPRLILMTGGATTVQQATLLAAGGAPVLEKPFQRDALRAALLGVAVGPGAAPRSG